MTTLANKVEGILSVSGSSERTARFPSPAIGQKVYNRTTDALEEWNGSSWVPKLNGGQANVLSSGAIGDGTTNDRTALAAADTAALLNHAAVYFPPGTYRVSTNLTITSPVQFAPGARLKPDNGVTVTLSAAVIAGAYQIIDGSAGGLLALAPGAAAPILADWWGLTLDDATSNDTTLQKAINALSGTGLRLRIPKKAKYTNGLIWKGVRYDTEQAPCRVGSTLLPSGSTNAGMCSDGGTLYVCEYTNGAISQFDIADRRNPRWVRKQSVGNNPRACAIIGSYLAVVCLGDNAVKIYDRTAASLSLAFTITTQTTPKDLVVINDRYLYVICSSGYLQKWELDFVNATAYKLWETATVGAAPLHVSHYNGVLYVVGSSSIVDCFNANGTRIGGYEILTSTANSATLPVGPYLFVVSAGALDKLYVLNIQDPTTPTLVTSLSVSNEPAWLALAGRFLYVSSLTPNPTPGAIDCIDITDPAAPVLAKTVACQAVGTCFSVIVDERYLYVNGHDSPFYIDVLELPEPTPRTALIPPVDPDLRRSRKVDTVIVDTTLTTAHDILRVGLGKTVTLPNPNAVPLGKVVTIVNVSSTAIVSITNAFAGIATGTKIPPGGAMSLVATLFSGTYQWEPLSVGDVTRLRGSATYNPPSLVDGAGATTTVTVTGAVLGDYAIASFGIDTQGITVTAWVSAADTVSVRFQNETGGTLDLAQDTLRVLVIPK